MNGRRPTGRRRYARWRNCSHPSVHLTPYRSFMVLSPRLLRKMGRGVGDPVEVRLRPGQPGEVVAWFPGHLASPEDSPKWADRADPTIGPHVSPTAPIPPVPDDPTTWRPTAPLWPLQGPGLRGLPDGTVWQLPALVNYTATEDTYDHR